jgi:hypothetical protein
MKWTRNRRIMSVCFYGSSPKLLGEMRWSLMSGVNTEICRMNLISFPFWESRIEFIDSFIALTWTNFQTGLPSQTLSKFGCSEYDKYMYVCVCGYRFTCSKSGKLSPICVCMLTVWGTYCLRPLEHWDRGFESHSHGCISSFFCVVLSCV